MSLSIFDIATGISWTKEGKIFLNLNDAKYELLVGYLNAGNINDIKTDIRQLEKFQSIYSLNDKDKIEEYIMTELEGFNERDNGYSAFIAGAHDLSPSIQYNIKNNTCSIIHPNISTLEGFCTKPEDLINLLNQMIQVLSLKIKILEKLK